MKHFLLFFSLIFAFARGQSQLIINELSQGPSTVQEYVELLVTGTPVCGGGNTVDLRGWIIDDNNSWHAAGSGSGIAAGHVRFDSIAQWANVKIGTLILIYNDADPSPSIASLPNDTSDSNQDCVFVIPVSSSVLLKNITLPGSNGTMSTYDVPGTVYSPSGNWSCLGMANSGDAFHTVSPVDYANSYHAIGWGNNSTAVDVYYSVTQSGSVIYMANLISNDPFDANNYVDSSALTNETPGAPNNPANAAWIRAMNNNCQPFVAPTVSFNIPTPLSCTNSYSVLIASSGTSGATFNWSNGISGSNDTVNTGGTYHVTVSDAGNICHTTDSVVIAAASVLSVSLASTASSCGNNNGTATVTLTSGTATAYTWSSGATSATATNLASGLYRVTVTGTGGCSAVDSVNVTASGSLSISTSSVNTTCGNNNGSSSVTVTAGSAISYHWSNGGTNDTISSLAAGNYSVTVDGGGGCSATAAVTINPSGNTPVTISADTTIFCSGDSTRICAPAGYRSYIWNGGDTSHCIFAKQAGNYYVQVTDNGNCTASSNHIAISVHPVPPVSISLNGDTISAYGSVTYHWFLDNSQIPGADSSFYIASQPGSYTVLVTDTNGCPALSSAVIINAVGISDLLKESGFQIYPNPLSSDSWNLLTGVNLLGAQVEILDNNGKLIYKSVINGPRSEIHFDLARGIYLLKIFTGKETITRKLIRL